MHATTYSKFAEVEFGGERIKIIEIAFYELASESHCHDAIHKNLNVTAVKKLCYVKEML